MGLRRWIAKWKAKMRPKLVVRPFKDEYIDPGALRSRSATPQGKEQFVVTLKGPGGSLLKLYAGPRGAQARQVFESVFPRAGEVMEFWDGESLRGVKSAYSTEA